MDEVKERLCETEDKNSEIIQSKGTKEKRRRKCEESLRDLQDNTKRTNLRIIGVPKGEERVSRAEWSFKI